MSTLNVRDYGAVGDGSVPDESFAINQALQDARLLADPAKTVVLVPAGLYRIQNGLRIGSYTHLLLESEARIVWNTPTTFIEPILVYNIAPVTGYDGEHDWIIEGGTLDGNRRQVTDGRNILAFGHCRNVTVRGVRFTGCSEDHCIECNSSQHVVIEDCLFTDSAGSTEAIQLDGAFSASTFPQFGAWDDTPCDDVLIQRCLFRDGIVDGIGSHTVQVGKPHTNVVIRDCEIHCTGTALKLNNYPGVVWDNVRGSALTFLLVNDQSRDFLVTSGSLIPTPYVPPTYPALDPPIGGPKIMHVGFYINDGGSGQMSNAPASTLEIFNNTKRRTAKDLTGYTQGRLLTTVAITGATTARLVLLYSTDQGATWQALGPEVGIGSVGQKVGSWISLAASGDLWLKVDHVDGNGTADPAFGRIDAEFR